MPTAQDLTAQGIARSKAGDKAGARALLTQAVQLDPRFEVAWLWLSSTLDAPAERRYCLERALQINPASEPARRGLAQLAEPAAVTPAPAAAPVAAPEPQAPPAAAVQEPARPPEPPMVAAEPAPPASPPTLREHLPKPALVPVPVPITLVPQPPASGIPPRPPVRPATSGSKIGTIAAVAAVGGGKAAWWSVSRWWKWAASRKTVNGRIWAFGGSLLTVFIFCCVGLSFARTSAQRIGLLATNTPRPTATITPSPTATLTPSTTPSPAPTDVPTSTPVPPTITAVPTAAPEVLTAQALALTPTAASTATLAPTEEPTATEEPTETPVITNPKGHAPTNGDCDYPYYIKVSKNNIYHDLDSRSYKRTVPKWCYASTTDAAAAGYVGAKD